MGVRVIIDYSARAGKNGDAYYRMFPREPSALPEWDMEIDPEEIVRIEGMTLLKVLEALAAPPVPSVAMILTHGVVRREGDGMVMPIGPAARGSSAAAATTEALTAICDCAANMRRADREIQPARDLATWVRFIRNDLGGTDYQGFLDAFDWAEEIRQMGDAEQRSEQWRQFLERWDLFLGAFTGSTPRGTPPPQADSGRIGRWLAEIRSGLLAILERYPREQYLRNVAEYRLFVSRETLERIIATREALQGQLDRVEFRACNFGKLDYILETIRKFLGARCVTAPKNWMLYAKVDPVLSFPDSTFQQWVETHEGPAVSVVYEGTTAPSERTFQDAFLSTLVCLPVRPGAPVPGGGSEFCMPSVRRDPSTDTFFLKIWEEAVEPVHVWGISVAARGPDDVQHWIDRYIYPKSDVAGTSFYIEVIWTFGVPGVEQPYVLPRSPDYRFMIGYVCSS